MEVVNLVLIVVINGNWWRFFSPTQPPRRGGAECSDFTTIPLGGEGGSVFVFIFSAHNFVLNRRLETAVPINILNCILCCLQIEHRRKCRLFHRWLLVLLEAFCLQARRCSIFPANPSLRCTFAKPPY